MKGWPTFVIRGNPRQVLSGDVFRRRHTLLHRVLELDDGLLEYRKGRPFTRAEVPIDDARKLKRSETHGIRAVDHVPSRFGDAADFAAGARHKCVLAGIRGFSRD